ncbi:amidohydrolase family protein [Labilibaculum filiforme]
MSLEKIVEKMCHTPAEIFQVEKRGFIRKGYYADLVLLKEEDWTATNANSLYKCGWTPFDGETFQYKVDKTFVNGHLAYNNGVFDESTKGMRLSFER